MSEKIREEKEERTWSETIEITGNRLVEEVKELVQEGSVRRLIIRKPDNEVLMEIPLTAGVAVGGVMALFAPLLAALGALAALIAHFRVEIVRTQEDDGSEPKIKEIESKCWILNWF